MKTQVLRMGSRGDGKKWLARRGDPGSSFKRFVFRFADKNVDPSPFRLALLRVWNCKLRKLLQLSYGLIDNFRRQNTQPVMRIKSDEQRCKQCPIGLLDVQLHLSNVSLALCDTGVGLSCVIGQTLDLFFHFSDIVCVVLSASSGCCASRLMEKYSPAFTKRWLIWVRFGIAHIAKMPAPKKTATPAREIL